MGTRLPAILFAVAVGGAVSAAFFVALSHQPSARTLVAGQPLQYWVQCLDSGEDDLREAARRNLPKFGVDAVGPLIERLDAESRAVSTASAAAIGKIPTAVTVPLLAASLRPGGADGRGNGGSATPARRIKAIEVLAAMPAAASAPAIDDVARQLDDPDVCHTAADYVIAQGAGPHVIAVAARVLAGTEQYCRLQAIRVLCASPADPQVAPALVANMDCTEPAVRMAAWGALPTLPSVPPQAIERLCRGLADRQTRRISESLLFKAGPSAIDPLRWTRQRMGENDPQLRRFIADRIEQIRRAYPSTATSTLPTPPSVPLDFTLARTLEERRRIVDLLSYASDPAKYDLMIKALGDVDPGTRRAALVPMGRSLQSQKIVDAVVAALNDPAPFVRAGAAEALTSQRDDAAVRAKLTESIRHDDDPTVIVAAEKALRPD
jgi:HEAT repeat protein